MALDPAEPADRFDSTINLDCHLRV